jgi:TonB family protein
MWRINSFANTTLIALCLVLNTRPAQSSLEKQAVANTQRTLASDLDAELPKLPFAEWLGKVVGEDAGISWQLSECGERSEATANGRAGDARACVEANSILRDGRRVIVMIAVGTFKQGITGPPAFHFAVIEQKGELQPIRRLRDVQWGLLNPEKLAKRPPVELPSLNIAKVSLAVNRGYINGEPMWNGEEGRVMPAEDLSPPPPQAASIEETLERTIDGVKVLGSVTWGGVITKVQPRYPAGAKRYNISGAVDVQVTISAHGRVTEAKASAGHPLLREAAEEAARQWVFRPATLKGLPVETQVVLTFLFKIPQ